MSAPAVTRTRAGLAEELGPRHAAGRVALVPTMGALHAGHRELVRAARAAVGPDGTVVVSVFVNPTQFGEGEDLDHYPRQEEADLAVCAEEGADVVFTPAVAEVYPEGPGAADAVTVDPGPLEHRWEGRSRPGHFRGVLTVCAKLFGIVRPDVAVFGEKDYQQLVLVRRLVRDLCLGVEVLGAGTVREDDGVALSSRNAYLSAEERRQARALHRTLTAARAAAPRGYDAALHAARAELRQAHGVDLDYLAVTDPELDDPPAAGEGRVLIAARVGDTRLIDNMPLVLGRTSDAVPQGAWSDGTARPSAQPDHASSATEGST